MNWLNYHHLCYFREIARSGSISAAAQKLRIGQPGLSDQLKTFEDHLQIKLFNRHGKKLTITAAGQQVLEYAERIGQLGEELLHVVEEKTFSSYGLLQVGVLEGISQTIVTNLVETVLAEKKIRISIHQAPAPQLVQELRDWHLDLILSNHLPPSDSKSDFYSRKFHSSPVSIYASDDFIKKNDFTSFNSNLEYPFVLPLPRTKMRNQIDHALKILGAQVDIIIETHDLNLQMMLASKNHGFIALTDIAAEAMVTQKQLVKVIELPNIVEEYFLIYPERMATHTGLQILLERPWLNIDI